MRNIVQKLASAMAIAGGATLCALILLTCISVAGRMLNTFLHGPVEALLPGFSAWALDLGIGPITGDLELVEAGVAFAIFAFLPWCQLTSGHAVVDIFTNRLSDRANRALRFVTELVFAAVLVLIAVQLYGGMMTKLRFGDTSYLLEFPIWWGYAASLLAAVVAALTALFTAYERGLALLAGTEVPEQNSGTAE